MTNEDNYTSTVDGAAGFERMRAKTDLDRDAEEEYYLPNDGEEYEDDGECHCSDPGCPCGGYKTFRRAVG